MNTSTDAAPTHIVVDWGTSRLRASLVDDNGRTFGTVATDQGIQHVARDTHAEILCDVINPWRQEFGPKPIYASGMISSRNGWLELPCVPCPAGIAEISAAMHVVTLDDGLSIHIVPGLVDESRHPFPDVMRGEETQILGAVMQHGNVVLPGTHSKWATVENACIAAFHTVVTGELYRVMRQHSFVAAGPDLDSLNESVFRQGIAIAKQEPAGLQTHLFGVRAGVLADKLALDTAGDYLSGLLIGHEFAASAIQHEPLLVIGNKSLTQRYLIAADELDIKAMAGPSDAGLLGIRHLRRHHETSSPR